MSRFCDETPSADLGRLPNAQQVKNQPGAAYDTLVRARTVKVERTQRILKVQRTQRILKVEHIESMLKVTKWALQGAWEGCCWWHEMGAARSTRRMLLVARNGRCKEHGKDVVGGTKWLLQEKNV
jgi:hypothetical protein